MTKRRTPRTPAAPAPAAAQPAPVRSGDAWLLSGLVVLAFLNGLLAVYQWMELVRTLDGVQAFCAIGEGLDCSKVWGSGFAKAVHRFTGLPLAGWGLVWSAAALVAALAALRARAAGSSSGVDAVRWVGVGGLLACVLFLGVSVGLGTLCLTCLTTYVLTALYAVATFRLPSEAWLRLPGVRIPAATVAVVYLLLLYPGRATPTSSGDAVQQALQNSRKSAPAKQPTPSAPPPRNEPSRPASPLARFLRELPGPARRAVVDAVQAYRSSEPVVEDRYGTRPKVGPAGAPVRIVDFVDVGCSHCAHLMETLDQIRRELPGSPFTVETRYFPLDGACNAVIPGGSGDPLSTRCLGAKLLLCGQDNAGYDALKHRIFENHARLTPADLYRWSTELLGEERGALDACVNDSKTEKKLAADVDFAKNFNPRGTPIVVINGREAAPLPPFLYAIILAQGDPKASGFQELGL